jgi:hypothetical protein
MKITTKETKSNTRVGAFEERTTAALRAPRLLSYFGSIINLAHFYV